MYPILYRKKTRTAFLAALLFFALLLRVLCEPGARSLLLEKARAFLGGEALFRAVIFLETGVLPEKQAERMDKPPKPGTARTAPAPESSGAAETAPSAEPDAEASRSETPPAAFTAEEAEAIGLRGNCSYSVDKTDLLLRPLGWQARPGPQVLILHSHSCESYTPCEGHEYTPSGNFRTLDPENSVIAVGEALLEELGKLGVEAIHDRSLNDYPDYNQSYANARAHTQALLAQYPSVRLVIDLHRDALDSPVRETVERDGQILAPLMLAVGTDEGGLNHPHWEDNLSCGLKLQAIGLRDQPSLFKKLSFRKERFNGDLSPGALIVEVGSTENSLPEATASMVYFAAYIAELLRCA